MLCLELFPPKSSTLHCKSSPGYFKHKKFLIFYYSTKIDILGNVHIRRLLLVGIVNTNLLTHNLPSLHAMLFAWCITEVVRYGYFALKQVGVESRALTWLRYSLFIVLYPIGGSVTQKDVSFMIYQLLI
jgi:hypothetical protein